MGKYRKEVERGAAFLDERRPGWRRRIDLDRLALRECTRCVLGQLSGGENEDWLSIMSAFGIDEWANEEYALGFAIDTFHLPSSEKDREYAALTEEWREYIRETQSGVSS
jgi:hypothetical protein